MTARQRQEGTLLASSTSSYKYEGCSAKYSVSAKPARNVTIERKYLSTVSLSLSLSHWASNTCIKHASIHLSAITAWELSNH